MIFNNICVVVKYLRVKQELTKRGILAFNAEIRQGHKCFAESNTPAYYIKAYIQSRRVIQHSDTQLKDTHIVKNLFGLFSHIFSFNVIDKSYRQVLTPVNNSQLLLKLAILDKFRFVTFHSMATQKKLQYTSLGQTRVLMTLIHNALF